MISPKLTRHLNGKNTRSDHNIIHRHRNLNETKSSENAHIMLQMAGKCSNYARNWGLCFSRPIMQKIMLAYCINAYSATWMEKIVCGNGKFIHLQSMYELHVDLQYIETCPHNVEVNSQYCRPKLNTMGHNWTWPSSVQTLSRGINREGLSWKAGNPHDWVQWYRDSTLSIG